MSHVHFEQLPATAAVGHLTPPNGNEIVVAVVQVFAKEGLRYVTDGSVPVPEVRGHLLADQAVLELRNHEIVGLRWVAEKTAGTVAATLKAKKGAGE